MPKKILFVHHCSTIGGASWCLYEILKFLDRSRFEPVVLLTSEGPLVGRIRSLDIPVIIHPRIAEFPVYTASWLPLVKRLMLYPVMQQDFFKVCQEIKPDILCLNTTAQLFLPWPAKRAGVKKVFLYNRELWDITRSWRVRHVLKNGIVKRFVDQIFSITQAGIDRFGFPEKSTVVRDWPSFDDESKLEVRASLGIFPDQFLILLTGGFQEIKGTKDVLRALQYMKHQDQVVVVVLGCVELPEISRKKIVRLLRGRKTYAQQVQECIGNRSNIHLLPPTFQVKAYIEASNVLVAPFTMPHAAKAALEAQLLGVPAVLYDSGPAREYVKEGCTGLIVPIGNIKKLAAALDHLVEESGSSGQRAEDVRRFIESEFSPEKSMQLIQDSFSSV